MGSLRHFTRSGIEARESGLYLQLQILPVAHGDSVLLEYGNGKLQHRVLIDGGPAKAYGILRGRVERLRERRIDLVVVSHIDADHIDGISLLMQDDDLSLEVGEVWFNGWPQLARLGRPVHRVLGPADGEWLGSQLSTGYWPDKWNGATDFRSISVPRGGPLPRFALPLGATIEIWSPISSDLETLRRAWSEAIQRKGLRPGTSEAGMGAGRRLSRSRRTLAGTPRLDSSVTNRSSLALLFEFRGTRILLPGDSHPTTLADSAKRSYAASPSGVANVDVLQAPHHGSKANLSRRMLDSIKFRHCMISSDGSKHGHPHAEAVESLVENRNSAALDVWFNHDNAAIRRVTGISAEGVTTHVSSTDDGIVWRRDV